MPVYVVYFIISSKSSVDGADKVVDENQSYHKIRTNLISVDCADLISVDGANLFSVDGLDKVVDEDKSDEIRSESYHIRRKFDLNRWLGQGCR